VDPLIMATVFEYIVSVEID